MLKEICCLEDLEQLSNYFCDTGYKLYAPKELKQMRAILNNMLSIINDRLIDAAEQGCIDSVKSRR